MAPLSNKHILDLISHSAAQTQRWGARIGELAEPGDVICLEGDLGSGKTCFVQGIGRGLGIPTDINSPTFILANEHRGGRLTLYHLDMYRVASAREVLGIGLEDYLDGGGVCVIEWAEKIREVLPAECLWITFRYLGESKRGVLMQAYGTRYDTVLHAFKASAFG
jgi:tRNA threonylcarbamoyladenosine biosynthesis protein TsaE